MCLLSMQFLRIESDFQATITAYDTTSAIIGSVFVNGKTQDTTGTLPVIGATSPVPIAKLVLVTQDLSASLGHFLFGTIYFDPGMSVGKSARPLGAP